MTDGRESVSDDKAGLSFHKTLHGGLNLNLGSGIHVRGRFIQNQNLSVQQEGSGDC